MPAGVNVWSREGGRLRDSSFTCKGTTVQTQANGQVMSVIRITF